MTPNTKCKSIKKLKISEKGFKGWNKITESVKTYHNRDQYKDAVNFCKRMNSLVTFDELVDKNVTKRLSTEQNNNRKYLSLVILTIMVLGKQEMLFQGKTTDSRNVMAMLEHKIHKTKDYQDSKTQNETINIFMIWNCSKHYEK